MCITEYDEERTMREMKEDAFDDGYDEGYGEGYGEGYDEGYLKGKLIVLNKMIIEGQISVKAAAENMGMTVDEFKKKLDEMK